MDGSGQTRAFLHPCRCRCPVRCHSTLSEITIVSRAHVLVIGSSNTDLIVQSESLPSPGQTVMADAFSTLPGGKGANQAVAAARAGAHVTFIARIGSDAFGLQALRCLEAEGIDTTFVSRDPDLVSGIASILVDGRGENVIAVVPGANAGLSPVQIDDAVSLFERVSICLLQLETPLPTVLHATGLAKEHGVPVILNPAPGRKLPPQLLSDLFLLTPNQTETEILTGILPDSDKTARQAADILMDRGVNNVIITLGARGALLATDRETVMVPAPMVDVRDTTGAGDAFNGALAAALGQARSLADAVAFANCAGALAVTRVGAQSALPRETQIRALVDPRPH